MTSGPVGPSSGRLTRPLSIVIAAALMILLFQNCGSSMAVKPGLIAEKTTVNGERLTSPPVATDDPTPKPDNGSPTTPGNGGGTTPNPPPSQPPATSGLKLPYQNSKATITLWVSPNGDDGANGSENAPLRTIQAAVNRTKGKPGTDILVKAGTYGGLNIGGLYGTAEKPIRLISADGAGKARINGPANTAAVIGYGLAYVGIYGFHVVCNYPGDEDLGGFKIWGPWEKPVTGLVLAGNLVSGQGIDGIKLFGGTKNTLVVGNVIEGNWRQEALDNVSIEDVVFAYNSVVGYSKSIGFVAKAGSRRVELVGNLFDGDIAVGVFIGGIGNSRLTRSFPAYWEGFEAKFMNVHHNVFTNKIRGKAAIFVGANNSILEKNYIDGTVGSREALEIYNYNSFDNKVVNNSVTSADFFQPDAGQSKGYVVSGNVVAGPKPSAGAASSEAQAFLKSLGL